MFNPFVPYDSKYLAGFRQKGVKAFVKQYYPRGNNPLVQDAPPALLLSHYHDLKKAEDHYGVIAHDVHRQLLVMDKAEDQALLLSLGDKNRGIPVFLPFKLPDAEHRARKVLDKKLRAYIDFKLNWRVPGQHSVQFSLDVIFGEIYAVLKHGGLVHTVRLDDIENTSGYVL